MTVEPERIENRLQQTIRELMHKHEIGKLLLESIRIVDQGERYLSPKARTACGKDAE